MKFTKHTFLMLGLASMFSVCVVNDAVAKACNKKDISAGWWCKAGGGEFKCREGCYCTGAYKHDGVPTSRNMIVYCHDRGNDGAYSEYGIHLCPTSFKHSNEQASSASDCYNDHGLYYRKYSCSSGSYLPANSGTCASCPSNESCPGGSWYPSDQDQGKSACGGEMMPNSDRSKCIVSCNAGKYLPKNETSCADCPSEKYCPGGGPWEKKPQDQGLSTCPENMAPTNDGSMCKVQITCSDGSYLPESSETCTKCPEGYYCPGGSYIPSFYDVGKERCPDQNNQGDVPNEQRNGCVSCPAGKEPDEDHATCVDKKTFVAPGYYFKENSIEPVPCTGAKKFCPGGKFYKKSVEQGRYDCPFNSNANSTHTGCSVKLTQAQMRNGVSGKGNCWKITDPEDYKYCIYGVRFLENEELEYEAGAQGTTNPETSEDTSNNSEDVYYKKTSGDLFDLSPSSFTKVNGKPDDLCNGGYWSYSEEHGFIQVKCIRRR